MPQSLAHLSLVRHTAFLALRDLAALPADDRAFLCTGLAYIFAATGDVEASKRAALAALASNPEIDRDQARLVEFLTLFTEEYEKLRSSKE